MPRHCIGALLYDIACTGYRRISEQSAIEIGGGVLENDRLDLPAVALWVPLRSKHRFSCWR